MDKKTTKERREFLRAPLNVFLTEKQRDTSAVGKAIDISEAGICYCTPSSSVHFSSSLPISLRFELPNQEPPIEVLGQVVTERNHQASNFTAIQFTQVTIKDAKRIRNYVLARKRAELFEQLRKYHVGE